MKRIDNINNLLGVIQNSNTFTFSKNIWKIQNGSLYLYSRKLKSFVYLNLQNLNDEEKNMYEKKIKEMYVRRQINVKIT